MFTPLTDWQNKQPQTNQNQTLNYSHTPHRISGETNRLFFVIHLLCVSVEDTEVNNFKHT